MTSILSVSSVTVQFGGLLALDNVTLDVEKGELLSLIGPNGAGKTTLLKSIIGTVTPVSAKLILGNADITTQPTHKRARLGLGMTHQIVRPFSNMSVLENVMFAAGHEKVSRTLKALVTLNRKPEKALAMACLERVGIDSHADQEVSSQPLGVLKRLEVARALSQSPRVLLLDEPLAGLNSREAAMLADTIREIADQGITIVMIEHNLSEVLRISDRLHVLDNGRNLAHGAPVEVMKQPDVRAAYLGG